MSRCGKVVHWERKDAKRVAKRKGVHLMAYWCESCTGWHVGSPPPALLAGTISRSQVHHPGSI